MTEQDLIIQDIRRENEALRAYAGCSAKCLRKGGLRHEKI